MGLFRRVVWGGFASAVVAGCAAVTGLGDFEIVDCPGDLGVCGDGGSDGNPVPPSSGHDGASPATDAESNADSTIPGEDGSTEPDGAGLPDSGPAGPFDGAPALAPDCGTSACPSAIGGTCTQERCTNALVWPVTTADGGGVEIIPSESLCAAAADNGGVGYVSNALDGGAHYEWDLRFLIETPPGAANLDAPIAEIDLGGATITLNALDPSTVELCTARGTCSAALPLPSTRAARVDIYGVAGTNVPVGSAIIILGTTAMTAACSQAAILTVPGPATGRPTAKVGCLGSPCELAFEDVLFSVVDL